MATTPIEKAPVKDEDLRAFALLQIQGQLEYVESKGITDLRKVLKKYPASALVCVWRGRKIPLIREVKVSFSGGLPK